MDFEDIVDMDWLNSHTHELPCKTECAEVPWEESFATLSHSPPSLTHPLHPHDALLPTNDQIKQLIEMAKHQLALRDQSHSTISPSSVFGPSCTSPSLREQREPRDQRTHRASSVSSSSDDSSLEALAEADGMDIKKLTARERRQLRNKISARNFRVRRKEYLASLEQQIDHHKQHAEDLAGRLEDAEEENERLRHELELLRKGASETTKKPMDCIVVSSAPAWEDTYSPSLTRELTHYLVNYFVPRTSVESHYALHHPLQSDDTWP
ncbi:hypothetical protein BDF14DRAFT_1839914 [Spinellus fusiger]|nr:hypothetical protein BDF14DRAFT_1839914 [Spinellus fusiger]